MNFKFLSLTLVCMVLSLFSACGHAPAPIEQNYSFASESQILHLDTTHKDYATLVNSPVFERALKQNAIINFNGECITSAEFAHWRLEAFLKAKTGTLVVYDFGSRGNSDEFAQCFVYEKNGKNLEVGCTHFKDWSFLDYFSDGEPFETLSINEYGYLIGTLGGEPIAIAPKVVNDVELDARIYELQQLGEQYLSPIHVDLCEGLLFTHPKHIGSRWVGLIHSFYQQLYPYNIYPSRSFKEDYPQYLIPLEDAYALISPYFDITLEEFEQYLTKIPKTEYGYYIPEKKLLFCYTERGGSSPILRVLDAVRQEDTLMLTAQLQSHVGVPHGSKISIKIKLLPDGTFHYETMTTRRMLDYFQKFSHGELALVKDAMYCIESADFLILTYQDSALIDTNAPPKVVGDTQYYPCSAFSSLEELHAYTQTVFSKRLCEEVFYHRHENQPELFIELKGALYGTDRLLGYGWNQFYDTYTINILEMTEQSATIEVNICDYDGAVTTEILPMVQENGRWVLDAYRMLG